MREKVSSHECAIAVTADRNAVAVADTHCREMMDSGFGVHGQLMNEIVVWLFAGIGSDDRHFGVVENGVSLRNPEDGRGPGDQGEAALAAPDLRATAAGMELAGVGPD